LGSLMVFLATSPAQVCRAACAADPMYPAVRAVDPTYPEVGLPTRREVVVGIRRAAAGETAPTEGVAQPRRTRRR
jgi:hypothetical protein